VPSCHASIERVVPVVHEQDGVVLKQPLNRTWSVDDLRATRAIRGQNLDATLLARPT
jgi:hypothetical protein